MTVSTETELRARSRWVRTVLGAQAEVSLGNLPPSLLYPAPPHFALRDQLSLASCAAGSVKAIHSPHPQKGA